MARNDEAQVAAIRREYPTGQRVRFLGFGEADPAALPIGTEGTVAHVDSLGTVQSTGTTVFGSAVSSAQDPGLAAIE